MIKNHALSSAKRKPATRLVSPGLVLKLELVSFTGGFTQAQSPRPSPSPLGLIARRAWKEVPEKFIGSKCEKLELKGLSFVGHIRFADGQKHALYLIARHLKRAIQEQYALLTGNHEPIWVPGFISAPWQKPNRIRSA